jgi:hypothetical protein
LNLTEILARCDAVLLDFDGPVADLFPRGSGSRIAEEARTPVHLAGGDRG